MLQVRYVEGYLSQKLMIGEWLVVKTKMKSTSSHLDKLMRIR